MVAARWIPALVVSVAVLAWESAPARSQSLHRHEASRMSMACLYTIEMYGPDADALPEIGNEALDEVDRIDRLMSNYKPDSALSRINAEAARHPVRVDPELFEFLVLATAYNRDSGGAFDITVGPLMKAWGFFLAEGRVPAASELALARRHVGSKHLTLNRDQGTIAFDTGGVELDLGGIAKGYAVDRAVSVLKERKIAAALVSAGGSTIYGLGAPPAAAGWNVQIQDPLQGGKVATSVQLRDRALSVAGTSEKFFEAGGVRYSHIMDPRTGSPVQGVLSVAVLTSSGTAADALDDAFFVLGPERSRDYLKRLLPKTEAFFFLPTATDGWRMVHQ
jgi:thiamine biosynthesis lipoprotein